MNNWNSLADFIYMNGHGYYVDYSPPSDLSAHHARSTCSAVDAGKLIPLRLRPQGKKHERQN